MRQTILLRKKTLPNTGRNCAFEAAWKSRTCVYRNQVGNSEKNIHKSLKMLWQSTLKRALLEKTLKPITTITPPLRARSATQLARNQCGPQDLKPQREYLGHS